MGALTWRPLDGEDNEPVLATLSAWSSGRDFHALLPRLFFEHFSDTSLIVHDDDGTPAGFIIAFVSQADTSTGYIHFVWVSPELREQGLGRQLYDRVFALLRGRGCRRVVAVTIPDNSGSLAFHDRMGFRARDGGGPPALAPVVADHAGPGQHRVVLERDL